MENSLPVAARSHRPVPAGASLGEIKVVRSTAERLVLKRAVGFFRIMIAFGLVATVVGVLAYLNKATQGAPVWVHLMPLAGPGLVALGAMLLYRHKTFDGKKKGIL